MTERKTEGSFLVGMDAHSEKLQLCVCRWIPGGDPKRMESIATTVDALETTYAKHVPKGATTILEASTNAFQIVGRLKKAGYTALVANSDVLTGYARKDRINDAIDAYNLARAYARGAVRPVAVPDATTWQLRDILHGHEIAKKDAVRASNRIWSFCNEHGLRYCRSRFTPKTELIRRQIREEKWSGNECFEVEMRLEDYERFCEKRSAYERRMEQIVSETPAMLRLLQVLGIRYLTAFALIAYIGDIDRFNAPKKLVAYFGLNPVVCASGKDEGLGGMSRRGNGIVRAMLVEAAQASLRSGGGNLQKWARRKLAQGMNRNKVIVAMARKLVMYAWHILKGHPVPNRENEKSFRAKLLLLATCLGKEEIRRRGFKDRDAFAESIAGPLYSHLPPAPEGELQTGTAACVEAPPSRPCSQLPSAPTEKLHATA